MGEYRERQGPEEERQGSEERREKPNEPNELDKSNEPNEQITGKQITEKMCGVLMGDQELRYVRAPVAGAVALDEARRVQPRVRGDEARTLDQALERVGTAIDGLRRSLVIARIQTDPASAIREARIALNALPLHSVPIVGITFSDSTNRLGALLDEASATISTNRPLSIATILDFTNQLRDLSNALGVSRILLENGVPEGVDLDQVNLAINRTISDRDQRRRNNNFSLLHLYSDSPSVFLGADSSSQMNGRALFDRVILRSQQAHDGVRYTESDAREDTQLQESIVAFMSDARTRWVATTLDSLHGNLAQLNLMPLISETMREQAREIRERLETAILALTHERDTGQVRLREDEVREIVRGFDAFANGLIRPSRADQISGLFDRATELVHHTISPREGTSEWFGAAALAAHTRGDYFMFELAVATGHIVARAEALNGARRAGVLAFIPHSTYEAIVQTIRDPTRPRDPISSSVLAQLELAEIRVSLEGLRQRPEYAALLRDPRVVSSIREINDRVLWAITDQNANPARRLLNMVSTYLELLHRHGTAQWMGRREMELALDTESTSQAQVNTSVDFSRALARYRIWQDGESLRRSIATNWGRAFAPQSAVVNENLTALDRVLNEAVGDPTKLAQADQLLRMLTRYVESVERFGTRSSGQAIRSIDRRFDGRGMEVALAAVAGGRMDGARNPVDIFNQSYATNFLIILTSETERLENLVRTLRMDAVSNRITLAALETARTRVRSGDTEGAGILIGFVTEFLGSARAAAPGRAATADGWRYRSLSGAPRQAFLDAIAAETAVRESGVQLFRDALILTSRGQTQVADFSRITASLASDVRTQQLLRYERDPAHRTEFTGPTIDELLLRCQTAAASGNQRTYSAAIAAVNARLRIVTDRVNEVAAINDRNRVLGQLALRGPVDMTLRESLDLLVGNAPETIGMAPTARDAESITAWIRQLQNLQRRPGGRQIISDSDARMFLSLDLNRETLGNNIGRGGPGSGGPRVAGQGGAGPIGAGPSSGGFTAAAANEYASLLSQIDFTRRMVASRSGNSLAFIYGATPSTGDQALDLLAALERPLVRNASGVARVFASEAQQLDLRRAELMRAVHRGEIVSPAYREEFRSFVDSIQAHGSRIDASRYIAAQVTITERYIAHIATQGEVAVESRRSLQESLDYLRQVQHLLETGDTTGAQARYRDAMAQREAALGIYLPLIADSQGVRLPTVQAVSRFTQYFENQNLIFRAYLNPPANPQEMERVRVAETGVDLIERSVFGIPVNSRFTGLLARVYPGDTYFTTQNRVISNAFSNPAVAQVAFESARARLANTEFANQMGLLVVGIGITLANPVAGEMFFVGLAAQQVVSEYNSNPDHHVSAAAWINLGMMGTMAGSVRLATLFTRGANALSASIAAGDQLALREAQVLLARAGAFRTAAALTGGAMMVPLVPELVSAANRGDVRGVLLSGAMLTVPFVLGIRPALRAARENAFTREVHTWTEEASFRNSLELMREARSSEAAPSTVQSAVGSQQPAPGFQQPVPSLQQPASQMAIPARRAVPTTIESERDALDYLSYTAVADRDPRMVEVARRYPAAIRFILAEAVLAGRAQPTTGRLPGEGGEMVVPPRPTGLEGAPELTMPPSTSRGRRGSGTTPAHQFAEVGAGSVERPPAEVSPRPETGEVPLGEAPGRTPGEEVGRRPGEPVPSRPGSGAREPGYRMAGEGEGTGGRSAEPPSDVLNTNPEAQTEPQSRLTRAWAWVTSPFRASTVAQAAPVSEQFVLLARGQLESLVQMAISGDPTAPVPAEGTAARLGDPAAISHVGDIVRDLYLRAEAHGTDEAMCRTLMRRILSAEPVRTSLKALNDRTLNIAIQDIEGSVSAEVLRTSPQLRNDLIRLNTAVSQLLSRYSFQTESALRRATGGRPSATNLDEMITLVEVLERSRAANENPLDATRRRLGIGEIPPAHQVLILVDLMQRNMSVDPTHLFDLASQATTRGTGAIEAVRVAHPAGNPPQQIVLNRIGTNLSAVLEAGTSESTRRLDSALMAVLKNPETLAAIRTAYGDPVANALTRATSLEALTTALGQLPTAERPTSLSAFINALNAVTSEVGTAFDAVASVASRHTELANRVQQGADTLARENAPFFGSRGPLGAAFDWSTNWPRVRRWWEMTALQEQMAGRTWQGTLRESAKIRTISRILTSPDGVAVLAVLGVSAYSIIHAAREAVARRAAAHEIVGRVMAPLQNLSESDLRWVETNAAYLVALGSQGVVAENSVNVSSMNEPARWSALFEPAESRVLNPAKAHEFVLLGRYLEARYNGQPTADIERELRSSGITDYTRLTFPSGHSIPTPFYQLIQSNLAIFERNGLIISRAEAMAHNFCRDYRITRGGVAGRTLLLNGHEVAFNMDNVSRFLSENRGTFHFLMSSMREGRLPIAYLADAINALSRDPSARTLLQTRMSERDAPIRARNLSELYASPPGALTTAHVIFPAPINSGSFLAVLDYHGLRGGVFNAEARRYLDLARIEYAGGNTSLLDAFNGFVIPYDDPNAILPSSQDIFGNPTDVYNAIRLQLASAEVQTALRAAVTGQEAQAIAMHAGEAARNQMRLRGYVMPAFLSVYEPRFANLTNTILDPSINTSMSVDTVQILALIQSKSTPDANGMPNVNAPGLIKWIQEHRLNLRRSDGSSTILEVLYLALNNPNIRTAQVSGSPGTLGVEGRMDNLIDQLESWGLWSGETPNARERASREAARNQRAQNAPSTAERTVQAVRDANAPHPLPIGVSFQARTPEELSRLAEDARARTESQRLGLEQTRLTREVNVLDQNVASMFMGTNEVDSTTNQRINVGSIGVAIQRMTATTTGVVPRRRGTTPTRIPSGTSLRPYFVSNPNLLGPNGLQRYGVTADDDTQLTNFAMRMILAMSDVVARSPPGTRERPNPFAARIVSFRTTLLAIGITPSLVDGQLVLTQDPAATLRRGSALPDFLRRYVLPIDARGMGEIESVLVVWRSLQLPAPGPQTPAAR